MIEDEKVPKDMLDLAPHIVESKKGKFEPEKFEDDHENALKELPRKKQKGERIERPKEPSRTDVVNLMAALRRSVAQEKRPSASPKKARKRIAGHTEMLLPIAGKKGKEVAANPWQSRARGRSELVDGCPTTTSPYREIGRPRLVDSNSSGFLRTPFRHQTRYMV
jgi:DNA end-binding protein Ku